MAEKPTYEALERRLEGLEMRFHECEEKEHALRRKYKRLHAAVESVPFDFFAIDAHGRYEMQNSVCIKHWGDVIGKRPQDLGVNSDTLALWLDNNRRALSGETVRADVAFPVAGEKRHFHNIISPIIEDGEVDGIVGINIDITERKRTEEGLRATLAREQEEAAKSEAIIASIGDGLSILDTNFRILYENKIHQDIFGEHIGEHCYMAYQNKDQVCEGCPAAESLKDGKIHARERSVQGEKGIEYFEVTASPFVSWTGKIAGVIEVVRNITKRRQAEEALKKSERILSSTFEALDGLLVVIDRDRRVILSNWKGHDFVTEQNRQDRVYCYKAFKHLDAPCDYCPPMQTFADGQPRVYEDRNPVDGSFKEIHVTPIFEDAGKVVMVVEYVQDITERKQAQEALRLASERLEHLLSSSSAVIYAAKVSGDYGATFISENVVRVTGHEREEFLENARFWIDHVHPEDRPIVLEEVSKIFEKEFHAHEYRFQCKDGKYIWVGDEMRLVRDKDGQPLEIIGFWADSTLRKQTEQALLEKEKTLEDQAQRLERVNTALNVLLEHRENEKKELEENITANARRIIFPYIEKIENSRLTLENKTHLGAIKSNLEELISPFASKVSSRYMDFTPTETEIADHVRRGKTSKEISALLHVSLKAVSFHRYNIRKKLGISNKKVNLRSYLQSMSQ
jgi:PAS domain S-box-containing protein